MSKIEELAKNHHLMPYMVERYITLYGLKEAERLIHGFNVQIKASLRCNTTKIKPKVLSKRLHQKGILHYPLSEPPYGYEVTRTPVSLGATTEYLLGFYYLQAKASMLPVYVMDPRPGETVLDMAAAPGGKATQIAQHMNNKGVLILAEIDRRRIPSLQSNLNRCGVKNSIIFRIDGREIQQLDIKYDRVLLDAPCTGEGLIPLDKTRRYSRSQGDIKHLSLLQKQLIDTAARTLKPGGTLIYSTCSLAPEENEYVIDYLLRKHPKLHLIDTKLKTGNPGMKKAFNREFYKGMEKTRRFYPHIDGTIGFFIAKIHHEGDD
jgi:NOL1/NOP2/sun family putative RNA methylase